MRRPTPAHSDIRPARSSRVTLGVTPGKRRAMGVSALVPKPASAQGLRRLSAPDEFIPVSMTYAIRKWAVPDDALDDLPAEVDTFEPLGHPCHYRVRPATDYAIGHYEFCGLADGFFVHINDIQHHEPYALSVSAPDMLRLRIGSPDDCEYISDHASLDLKGAGAAIIVEPAGQPAATAVFAGHSVASNICIHRTTLRRLYAQREHELPAVIQAFLAGTLEHTFASRVPLSPALLRCLEDMHGCDIDGHSRRLFIRSKAVEALCHAFKALGQEDGAMLEASALIRRGVLKAQRILTDNFVAPPSLDDLAQAVGLSRSSLCTGFRQIIGQTVFDYIADLRMKQALTLLNRNDASITQIAYEVGYSHPSSFSLAVQRRFGATPSELRRRRLPGV